MTLDDEVRGALDHLAITRLQAAYGDAVTRRAWDEVAAMFSPGCPVRLDLRGGRIVELAGAEAVVDFVRTSFERFDFFAFTLLNAVVDVDVDRRQATGRMYIRELRRERDGERWTTAYGLYRDAYEDADGHWRFARRDYATLARTAADGDAMDVFDIPDG